MHKMAIKKIHIGRCQIRNIFVTEISFLIAIVTIFYFRMYLAIKSQFISSTELLYYRADSKLVPSQWETSLQSNAVSHWLGASLESALHYSAMSSSQ